METWSTIITAKATVKTEQNRNDQMIDDLLKILSDIHNRAKLRSKKGE